MRAAPYVPLTAAATLALLPLAGPGGCASPDTPDLREISLAEFSQSRPASTSADADAEPVAPPAMVSAVGTDEPVPPATAASTEPGREMIGPDRIPLQATNAPPERWLPMQPGESVIIDRMVGQINGRPVYADAFFEEIQDQLRAKGEELPRAEFIAVAGDIVTEHLREEVLNALYLAEAESRLTPQQQKGLLGMLGQVRERIVAGHRGSSILATEQIQSEREMSLDELVSEYKDQTLIYNLLNENVLPRVIVSWRDIEREYERRKHEFNPDPQIVLARIRLNTARDAERIEQVRQRLADGESFESVAMSLGQWDDGRWQSFVLGPDGIDSIALNEQIRSRLAELEVGETTEAFELGSSTWWIHFTAREQPAGRSLYDPEVQRALAGEIRGRRLAEEQGRYIRSLLEEGIYDELETMAARLIDIAINRYAADT